MGDGTCFGYSREAKNVLLQWGDGSKCKSIKRAQQARQHATPQYGSEMLGSSSINSADLGYGLRAVVPYDQARDPRSPKPRRQIKSRDKTFSSICRVIGDSTVRALGQARLRVALRL